MTIEQLGTITLVQGDCMEFMAEMPDFSFDLAIVDPPYGIDAGNYKGGGEFWGGFQAPRKKYHLGDWDKLPPPQAYFTELQRVSKNQIIWGGNYFIDKLKPTSCMIVWDKQNGENDFADCELAWTSFTSAVRKFTWRWNGCLQKVKQERIHPTEKPIQLYEWLLQKYAKKGDKILDTHGGSMSHAIACQRLGFDLTIIEKDPIYYHDAKERLIREQQQLQLFGK